MEFSGVAVIKLWSVWGYACCGICVGCGVQFCQFERVCCICCGTRL